MNSREKILQAIGRNKPEIVPLSEIRIPALEYEDKTLKFSSVLQSIGGQSFISKNKEVVKKYVLDHFKNKKIANLVPGLEYEGINVFEILDPHELEDVELSIVEGDFGVAENAAIWVTEKKIYHRVLPFICQHLIIVIKIENLVSNMHQAYSRIGIEENNYGVFIAGPSKTADIEQSLVIGAHGARSLTVFLLE